MREQASHGGPTSMIVKSRYALLALTLALVNVLGAYAQLRPEVTNPSNNPPPPKPAQIIIQTSPGAQVYLDDALKGQTNAEGRLVISNPAPGNHVVKVSLAGKQNYEKTFTLAAGQVMKITAELADLPGTVVVQSTPGAAVFLDGSIRGTTDAKGQLSVADVVAGSHNLKVSVGGKKDFEQQITVSAGQEARINAPLVDLTGTVVVNTFQGAEIYLDDSDRGSADAQGQLPIPAVAVGPHELRVSADGKKTFREKIIVAAGQETTIEAELVDLPPTTLRVNPKDGLKYQWIPAGTFLMGCSPGDGECDEAERPPHEVTISNGFWIGQTEVTVGAFKRFVAATGRFMPPAPDFNKNWADNNMPMVYVHWRDAQAYCKWAGGRLPTEAEWEYAARGGTKAARYGNLEEIAWDARNSGHGTHDVGQKRPNGFGVYDMLGNVLEWVADWYDPWYYKHSTPQDPLGPMNGKERVQRGGSFLNEPPEVRVSARFKYDPSYRNSSFGFRCAGISFGP